MKGCPSWCVRDDSHELHLGPVREADGIAVRAMLGVSRDAPEVLTVHLRTGDAFLRQSPRDARAHAALLEHLGHAALAGHLRKAADTAEAAVREPRYA